MAGEVNKTVLVLGEVRNHAGKERLDRKSGEFVPSGRHVHVMTPGNMLKLSVPEKFDETAFEIGSRIAVWADVLEWGFPASREGEAFKHGVAFVYTAHADLTVLADEFAPATV